MRRMTVPDTWRVAVEHGQPVLIRESGGLVLDAADPEGLVRSLFRIAQVPSLESAVEALSARLLNHEKAQPAYAEHDMRLVRMAQASLALTRPSPAEVARVLSLWRGRAA